MDMNPTNQVPLERMIKPSVREAMDRRLYEASLSGSVADLENLVGEDPLILDRASLTCFDQTPLHIAAWRGYSDFTRALLSRKPRLATELNSARCSPLHLASTEGHHEIVQHLLDVNDNVCEVHDEDGRTPLHLAAMKGRVEVIKLLTRARPESIRQKLGRGETVLHLCVKYNRLEALKTLIDELLIQNDARFVNSEDQDGNTILHLAAALKQLDITHMEMIKGIQGHGYYDELVVPIIENTAHERELTDSLAEAIEAYPKTTAVLVRNHGIYIWGDSWISAKTQAECYHYLFDAAIKLHQLGLDWSTPNHGPISRGVLGGHQNVDMSVKAGSLVSNNGIEPSRQRCIVLDIEGTTTPISFVTDVLFPYARDNVGRHLDATYDTAETKDDINLLRSQVQDDLERGIAGAVPIPSDDAGKEKVITALIANVEAMIKADRKITSLKQLQGHMWKTGFQNNDLEGIVFDDVPEALEKWHACGIKVYIYSSGSRLAQRLLFGYSNYGDLRKYLCGFFDTTVGNKKETSSYIEISESVGVDKPSQILFVTDVYQEAVAAKAAGLEVIISVRLGNGPLPENHGFKTINSFSEI